MSWFGGSQGDRATGLPVDSWGSMWVVGRTESADLTTKQAAQATHGGSSDAFAIRVSNAMVTAPPVSIGKDLELQFSIGLGIPAGAGGAQVTLTSSDPSKLLFSINPEDAGTSSVVLTASPSTQTAGPVYAHSLTDTGSATYTVSAQAYVSRNGVATFSPSGFLPLVFTTGATSAGNTITTTVSSTLAMQIYPVRLDPSSLASRAVQRLQGGAAPVSVTLTSTDPAVGTIDPATVVVTAAAPSSATSFLAKSAGTTTILIPPPAGFSAPALEPLKVSVILPALTLRNQAVGKDLQAEATLQLAAPAAASGAEVTVQSADPGKLLLSSDPAQQGKPNITVTILPSSQSARFYLQALAGSGSVRITAAAPGFSGATADITLTPSGFYLVTPASTGTDFTTTLISTPTMTVYTAQLDPTTLAIGQRQTLRSGLSPVPVSLTSSDPKVGVVTESPLIFAPGEGVRQTRFQPQSTGSTDLILATPSGFTTPANARQSRVTVNLPSFSARDITVGKDLQTRLNVSLPAPTPAGLVVTFSVSDPARAVLATAADASGTAQTTVSVFTNSSFVPDVYVQGLADSGSVQVSISARGFANAMVNVRLAPSGFTLSGGDIRTTLFGSNTDVRVTPVVLDPSTNAPVTTQAIRGGLENVSVEFSSSAPGVGVITTSPLTFARGEDSRYAQFRPVGIGTTILSVTAPPGFATPSSGRELRASVGTPALSLQSSYVLGRNLQVQASVSVPVTAPADTDITITSSDPSRLVLSVDPAAAGTPSITLRRVTGAFAFPQFYIQALQADGSATITASAPDFGNGTSTATLYPSGFAFSGSLPLTKDGAFNTTTLSPNTTLSVVPVVLSPSQSSTFTQMAVRGGLSGVSVTVTSSNTAAGTVTTSPVVFNGGDSGKSTAFHPVAVGVTNVAVGVPEGFDPPRDRREIPVNVTRPGLMLENLTVGENLQRTTAVTLAPGITVPSSGLTVTVTSLDSLKAILSTSPRATGAASIVVSLASSRSNDFYVQALAGEGTVTLKLSAENFADANSTVTLVPAGFSIGGVSSDGLRLTTLASPTQVSVFPLPLTTASDTSFPRQSIRGGFGDVAIEIASSDSSIAQVTSTPLVLHAGDANATFGIQPVAPGTATVTLKTPDRFSTGAADTQQLRVSVTAPRLQPGLDSSTIGKNLQTRGSLFLPVQPRDPVDVTISSSDTSRVLIAADRTAEGRSSVTIRATSSSSVSIT